MVQLFIQDIHLGFQDRVEDVLFHIIYAVFAMIAIFVQIFIMQVIYCIHLQIGVENIILN